MRFPHCRRLMGPTALAGLAIGLIGGPAAMVAMQPPAAEPGEVARLSRVAVFPTATPTALATPLPRRPIVAIDPGHGGPDDDEPRADRLGRILPGFREGVNSGAVYLDTDGAELREKHLTLRVALEAAELLEARGIGVLLTRSGDVPANLDRRDYNGDGGVDLVDELLARVALANRARADLLVSIHLNAHPDPEARGTYTTYAAGREFSERSRRLAQIIHARILHCLEREEASPLDRGVAADSDDDPLGRHLVLLGPRSARAPIETTMPGALLEPLFLTNPDEAKLLQRESVLSAVARAIAEGVLEYLGR